MAQEATRSGLVVVIPTTDAPIVVRQLTWLAKVPLSRVVLSNETSDECRRWSGDYNSLLRQGDPFRVLLDLPETGNYRLVATADIDLGKSWMTPVAAAHFGLAQGEAATPDAAKARLMVWGTGAIDLSVAATAQAAAVVPADYHLGAKIDRSRQLFAEAAHAGTPVLCLLPSGDETERAAAVLSKVLAKQPHHIAVVASLADVIAPLAAFLRTESFETPKPEPARGPGSSVAVVPLPKPDSSQGTAPGRAEPKHTASEAPASQPEPVAADEPVRAAGSGRGTHVVPPQVSQPRPVWLRPPVLAGLGLVAAGVAFAGYALIGPGGPSPDPAPKPATQQAAVQPAPPPPAPPSADPAAIKPALVRLMLLKPPKGADCRAVFYDAGKRYVETLVEVAEGSASVAIDAAGLCGLAVNPGSAGGVRFEKGAGPRRVDSQSTPRRIIFNPADVAGGVSSLPAIEIDQPAAARIALTPR